MRKNAPNCVLNLKKKSGGNTPDGGEFAGPENGGPKKNKD